jgi:DNA-binding GntR family transcriptional regulator
LTEYTPVRRPIADQMYEVLLGQFMNGSRAPSETLNIGALSRELNVSQTPLREALARLEHTGLVRREALRGYRVAPIMSRAEIAQLMDARLLLEPKLAGEAAKRVSQEFLNEINQTVSDFAAAEASADNESETFGVYWNADHQFHMLIAAQAGNPFLETAYQALGGQIQRFRLFSKMGHTGLSAAVPEHQAILDALKARDADAAGDAMRAHIEGAIERSLR